ncbi:hypothetical protein FE782_05355 [Paenibacillus antri]|uniref:Uncharacterized protein n=1 Tax=Paenibacillus antri TaxID=2582848 RepID=A0A5R9GEW5_9BACL|nr:hypothetical protein [Paenibacillus antri]TLS53699.1 hypothetical protein FE782_05355 [Paenibacillus antri]
MEIVPYYSENDGATPPDGSCVRLRPGDAPRRLEGAEDVWLESPDPALASAAARVVREPVLNSLPADEAAWASFGPEALKTFARIVLLPFAPGARSQSFEANLEAVLSLADRYGVPADRRIVDVCVLPRRIEPDPAPYAARIASLRARGFAACAGLPNFVHDDDETLLPAFAHRLAAAGLAYAVVSARFLRKEGGVLRSLDD